MVYARIEVCRFSVFQFSFFPVFGCKYLLYLLLVLYTKWNVSVCVLNYSYRLLNWVVSPYMCYARIEVCRFRFLVFPFSDAITCNTILLVLLYTTCNVSVCDLSFPYVAELSSLHTWSMLEWIEVCRFCFLRILAILTVRLVWIPHTMSLYVFLAVPLYGLAVPVSYWTQYFTWSMLE